MAERLPSSFRRDGQLLYASTGLSMRWLFDLYHLSMRARWGWLILSMWTGYLVIISVFALLYLLDGNNISGVEPGDSWAAFWFSVQTLSTIGYGTLSPTSWNSNAIATVESFVGLVMVAMGTGLMFAKFSRPSARVSFSNHIVVHRRNQVPCLMFRMANERSSQLVEANLQVSVILDETTAEGDRLRRFYPLQLERAHSPIFALSWLAIHPLTEDSPLHGLSPDDLQHKQTTIVVIFTGIDDLFAQSVHARHSYGADSIRFNHRFEDMLEQRPAGGVLIHHEKLHHTVPLGPDAPRRIPLSPAPDAPSSGS